MDSRDSQPQIQRAQRRVELTRRLSGGGMSLGTWERIKEALRRDWDQTKHDLGLASGHERRQGIADTIKQAVGSEDPGSEPPGEDRRSEGRDGNSKV